MRENMKNNISAISLFVDSLNKYEESLVKNAIDPTQFSKAAFHLEMALNRLISSNLPDTYQMMRHLVDRITLNEDEDYSESTILMLLSSTYSNVLKDTAMAIVYTLISLIRKDEKPVLDHLWMSKINSNEAIKLFIENYETSDQKRIKSTYSGNLIVPQTCGDIQYSEEERVVLPLGSQDVQLVLTATKKQVVSFVLCENVTTPEGYRSDSPTTIKSSVTIKPQLSSFILDRSVKFTETAMEIMKSMRCIENVLKVGSDIVITLPGQFFSCKLDMISIDGGSKWVVGNIQIIPPSMKS